MDTQRPLPENRALSGLGNSVAIGIVVVLCVLVAIAGFLFFQRSAFVVPPPIPIPTPNAYDEIVRIGRHVGETPDATKADVEALETFVAASRVLINAAHKALENDGVVPFDYSQEFFETEVDRLSHIRQVFRLLVLEAKYHREIHRPDDAAQVDVDMIAMARKISRGGVLVNRQVAMAYERVGWKDLVALGPDLTTEQKALVLQRLNQMPATESLGAVEQREFALGAKRIGRFHAMLSRHQLEEAFETTRVAEVATERLEMEARAALGEPR